MRLPSVRMVVHSLKQNGWKMSPDIARVIHLANGGFKQSRLVERGFLQERAKETHSRNREMSEVVYGTVNTVSIFFVLQAKSSYERLQNLSMGSMNQWLFLFQLRAGACALVSASARLVCVVIRTELKFVNVHVVYGYLGTCNHSTLCFRRLGIQLTFKFLHYFRQFL